MKPVLFLLMVLITGVYSQCGNFQAIWVTSYNWQNTATNYYYNHLIGTKYYCNENSFDNQLPPLDAQGNQVFYALYKRDNNDLTKLKKVYLNGLSSYDYFSWYFPAGIDGSADKPYVVWNIKIDCNGFLWYYIKYFNCDDQATDFISSVLGAGTKTIRYNFSTNALIATNIAGNECSRIASGAALITAFTSYVSTLDTQNNPSCTVCQYY